MFLFHCHCIAWPWKHKFWIQNEQYISYATQVMIIYRLHGINIWISNFEFVLHFVRLWHGDSVTKPDYYYYYYYYHYAGVFQKLCITIYVSHSFVQFFCNLQWLHFRFVSGINPDQRESQDSTTLMDSKIIGHRLLPRSCSCDGPLDSTIVMYYISTQKESDGPTWSTLPGHTGCRTAAWITIFDIRTRLHRFDIPSRVHFKLCFLAHGYLHDSAPLSRRIFHSWAQSGGVPIFVRPLPVYHVFHGTWTMIIVPQAFAVSSHAVWLKLSVDLCDFCMFATVQFYYYSWTIYNFRFQCLKKLGFNFVLVKL